MSYLHDLTAAGIGRVANPLGLPIRSGILRAETVNRTGQWEGDKDEVRVLIAARLSFIHIAAIHPHAVFSCKRMSVMPTADFSPRFRKTKNIFRFELVNK